MRRGQVLRSTGNEKRMRRHIFAMMAVALVIGTTQNPAAHAQGNMTPSGSALSAPTAQAEHSPANAATPSRTSDTSATPPPPGEPAIGIAELPQDLSPWGMFLHADVIVKGVMIGLAIASLVTWTIWFAKGFELQRARAAVRRDLRSLVNCPTLSQAHEQLRNGTSPTAQFAESRFRPPAAFRSPTRRRPQGAHRLAT
jgi:biopolymer transport protein ExbB